MEVKIDLKNCKTKLDLLLEFEKKLTFPSWWGKNWDALYDCLRDSNLNSMGKECKLVITNFKQLSDDKILKALLKDVENYHSNHKTMKFSYLFLD